MPAKLSSESTPFFSIVSPVYRCEKILPALVQRLQATLAPLGKSYEIILVDDASPDGSWSVLCQLHSLHPHLRILQLSRNFGQHHAITAGLERALGEWVVVMDCDLQDQPEEIPRLWAEAQRQSCDLVLAHRDNRQDSAVKRLSSFLFYRLLSYLCEEKINSAVANFGIYKKSVIEAVLKMRESSRYFPVFIQWVGFKKCTLKVTHAARPEGESAYNFRRSLNLALNIILASSDKPLRLMIKAGLGISFFSVLYALHILYRALNHQVSAPGWASLIISIWFWGGLLMSTLGVVGLYVGRSFEEAKARPLYLVREEWNA